MVGGTLTVYVAGTTTPTGTWQDSALSIANTNPITLDARGECVLWLDAAVVYKFVLKNAQGVIQWTQDNITNPAALSNTLRADLAAATGAALVGTAGSGGGAIAQTQSILNARITHADGYNTLLAAIDATPSGGTLKLGLGPYVSPGTVTRSHIRIVGAKMPWVNVGKTALTGGTIINGPLILDGDGITCENFGVDSGSAWCTASNGGVSANAFVAHDQMAATIRVNNHFRNIIGLCQNAAAAFHAVLIEGQQYGSADNIHGYYGNFGVVFKVSDYEIGKATGYENGQTNVYIKSESYAPVARVNAACLSGINLLTDATQPIAIHASTAPLKDVNIGLINVTGGQRQVRIISNISGVNIVDNVNVGMTNARGATQVGLDTYGIIYQSNFAVANIVNACGYGVNTQVNANGVHFGQINYTDTASLNKFDAVNLGGQTSFDNIIATNAYAFTAPTGINVTTGVSGTVCRVGNYVGRLNLNGGTLLNGWTAYGTPGAMLRGNRVHVYGRIYNAANKGAGKDNIMSINAALTNGVPRTFVISAYNGNNLDLGPTVVVNVAADGTLFFPQQNSVAFDPAKIAQIPLDGIFWDLDEPVH